MTDRTFYTILADVWMVALPVLMFAAWLVASLAASLR